MIFSAFNYKIRKLDLMILENVSFSYCLLYWEAEKIGGYTDKFWKGVWPQTFFLISVRSF